MAKNKHVDLFNDIIPSVDAGIRDLWDAVSDEGRKEIKNDLWNLNRFISNAQNANREVQEHYLVVVNEFYNKNWKEISDHPKLQWLTLVCCGHPNKKKQYHEFIHLKREKNKKEEFLGILFPNMKRSDIETLAAITTDKEVKKYCEDLGWDKKEINGIKL